MQKIITVLLMFGIYCNANAQSLQDQEIENITNQLVEKISNTSVQNIAVADFTNNTGSSTELGRYLAEEFSLALTIADKNFNVIDRSRVKFLLEEQGLADDGLLDPNTVAKLGNVKGIDAIVTGSLTSTGDYIRLIIKVLNLETAALLTGTKGDLSKNPTIINLSANAMGNSKPGKPTRNSPLIANETNAVATTPASPIEIDKGLIAYYPFNGNAEDESKNNNNGVVYGATLTEDRFGNENAAFDFDGKDDFIEVLVDSEEFRTIDEFVLSFWINVKKFDKKVVLEDTYDRSIVFHGTSNSKSVRDDFYRDGFNVALIWLVDGTELVKGGFVKISSKKVSSMEVVTKNPQKNSWNHIVLMKKKGFGLLYINGDLKSKEKISLKILDMYHNLFVGTLDGNNPHKRALTENKYNHSFNGKIDDIAIYNRALSDEEILQLSNDK